MSRALKITCGYMSSQLPSGCWAEGAEQRSCFWSQAQVIPKKYVWAHTMGGHAESGHSCCSGWVIPSLAENVELLKWMRDNAYCHCPLLLNQEVDQLPQRDLAFPAAPRGCLSGTWCWYTLCLGKVWLEHNPGGWMRHAVPAFNLLNTVFPASFDTCPTCTVVQWMTCVIAVIHGNTPPHALRRKCLLLSGTRNFFYKKKKKLKEETKKDIWQTFNSQRKSLNRLKLGCLQRVFKSILQTLLFQSLCSFIYGKLNTG